MASCWEQRHERAPDTFDAAFRHSDGRQLNNGAPLRRMRTGADQGRRDARYLACGRTPCGVGPRSTACDDAPSLRWKHAPRRFERCTTAAIPPVAERGGLHGAPDFSSPVARALAATRTRALTSQEERRRWRRRSDSSHRLGRQDKAGCPASGAVRLKACLHVVS